MVQEVTMYQAVCDKCGKSHIDEFNGYVAWSDEWSAKQNAMDNGWIEIDSKLYCPDCIEYDENIDDYKVKKE